MEMPRKNGKSLLAAGIALYMLTSDGERGADIEGWAEGSFGGPGAEFSEGDAGGAG